MIDLFSDGRISTSQRNGLNYTYILFKKKKQYLRLHRKFKATIDLNQPSLTIFRVVTDILYVPKKPVILNRDLRSLVQTSYLVCIR